MADCGSWGKLQVRATRSPGVALVSNRHGRRPSSTESLPRVDDVAFAQVSAVADWTLPNSERVAAIVARGLTIW
jgi:hypothetical protein